MIRAVNNTILARPRPDIHAQLCRFASAGEEIDSAIFGKVRVDNTVSYEVTSKHNNFAFGEVLSMGNGPSWMAPEYLPRISPGAIIGFDLAQVSHAFPFEGQTLYLLPLDAALCRFDVGAQLPAPLGGYVMTEEDPISLRRLAMRDRKSELILPETTMQKGLKTNDRTWSRVTIAAEKVLDVGTGGYAIVEKNLDKPIGHKPSGEPVFERERTLLIPDRESIGKVALFLPTMSVDLFAYGARHRFSTWDRVRTLIDWGADGAMEGVAEDRAEARESAA